MNHALFAGGNLNESANRDDTSYAAGINTADFRLENNAFYGFLGL